VFEELRDDVFFKGGDIFDNEGLAVFGPATNLGVARINHVIGLLQKDGSLLCLLRKRDGLNPRLGHEGRFGDGVVHC